MLELFLDSFSCCARALQCFFFCSTFHCLHPGTVTMWMWTLCIAQIHFSAACGERMMPNSNFTLRITSTYAGSSLGAKAISSWRWWWMLFSLCFIISFSQPSRRRQERQKSRIFRWEIEDSSSDQQQPTRRDSFNFHPFIYMSDTLLKLQRSWAFFIFWRINNSCTVTTVKGLARRKRKKRKKLDRQVK